ncbi:hypothetical protein ACFJGV_12420 [Cnuibacter sp. UC19_7]|uniref:hypothetical protein n=1 Tax=Cnuibacter sp. UC19_7 TaxID=3350166 RepID=UPI003671A301
MELGTWGSYRLPEQLRAAYGVDTAQALADQLGAKDTPLTPELIAEAEAAFRAYRSGDTATGRRFLVDRLGVDGQRADDALAKLPRL